MAEGGRALPWRAALGASDTHGKAKHGRIEGVVAQFRSVYIEWCAGHEEVTIVRREVCDVLRCMIEHLEIAARRGDALGLPAESVQSFTSLESDVSYLQCFVRNAISLHARTVKVARICSVDILEIPGEVVQKLIDQRLYDQDAAERASFSQMSEQTFDELYAPTVSDAEEEDEDEE